MNKWIKLTDYQDTSIRRGSVLRIQKKIDGDFDWYPDAYTDFLIFDPLAKGVYGLMVVSGYKSGMIYVLFPPESKGDGGVGLQRGWLVENWKKWVYPDGSVDEAWIRSPETIEYFEGN
jgi:hypothetical protein